MRTTLAAAGIAAALALTGCGSLRARQVQMTRDKADVAPCKFVGDVTGRHFLDQAADLGGDVVLYHQTAFGIPGKEHPFKAYDCGGRYGGTVRAVPAATAPATSEPAASTPAPPPAKK